MWPSEESPAKRDETRSAVASPAKRDETRSAVESLAGDNEARPVEALDALPGGKFNGVVSLTGGRALPGGLAPLDV